MNGTDAKQVADVPGFEQRVADILQHKHRWRWRFLWLWIAVFSVVAIFLWHHNDDKVDKVQKTERRIIKMEKREECLHHHKLTYCIKHNP